MAVEMRLFFSLAVVVMFLIPTPVWAGKNILDWIDNSSNEDLFHIERKAEACGGAGVFAEITTAGINIQTFTDSIVTEGLTYCYRVSASITAGTSAYTNEAGRLVPIVFPMPPTEFAAP